MKQFLKKAVDYLAASSWSGRDRCLAGLEAAGRIQQKHRGPISGQIPVACSFLDEAFTSQNAIPLATDLSRVASNLVWLEAPRGKIGEPMDDRHAHCEIVGPDSDLFSAQLRLGAFLMAPDTNYPLHSHAADEIYLPISGDGEWRVQQHDYEEYRPGAIVQIGSWKPHALRSGKEPLLMLWAWFGCIDFGAYRLEDV
jgi:mannose-6-phosphate isomerase-like protein (cupin superfamily)